MGQYYNPQAELDIFARKLEPQETYESLLAQLGENEYLFAWYHRNDLPWDNAPFLRDKLEFEEFERLRKDGTTSLIGYYAVPGDVFLEKGFY